MARIIIPTPLRKFTDNEPSVNVESGSFKSVLDRIVSKFPALKDHLLDGQNQLNGFVKIFVGEEDINTLDGLNTQIGENDTVSIIPAIAGGKS